MNATLVQTVPAQGVVVPELVRAESPASVGVLQVDNDFEEERQGAKRKAADDGGEGTSKRRHHTIVVDESTDEETSLSVAAKEIAETSPPS